MEEATDLRRDISLKWKKYYEEYIYAVVNDKNSDMFVQFSTIFPDKISLPELLY